MKTHTLLGLSALAVIGLASPITSHAALVGYWGFNEGTGLIANDYTATNNDGTLNAGGQGVLPTWATGRTGNPGDFALDFNGRTDRVVVPITTSLSLTNAFTIAYWAKADFLGAYPYQMLFTNDVNGSARQWFIQGSNGGGDQMYMWSDANTAWRKGLGFKEGGTGTANLLWHHYAFSYSGGVVTPYVDGVAKTAQTIGGSPNFPSFTHLLIGGKNQNFTSFEGPMDDVVIFNNASNAATITTIMNGTNADMLAVNPVPEPTTALFGLALCGIGMLRRRARA